MKIPGELRAWLTDPHETAPDGDASERGTDSVQERLLKLTRALRPRRTDVAGALVLHHPSGPPFAAAYHERILIRGALVPAVLDAQPLDAVPGWLSITPDPVDITFTRGTDVLRDALVRAFGTAAASSP